MKVTARTKKYNGKIIAEIPKEVIERLRLKNNQTVYVTNFKITPFKAWSFVSIQNTSAFTNPTFQGGMAHRVFDLSNIKKIMQE